MQIAQLFFHNSILIASRTADFWCFLKELAGLNRILIGFCDLFRQILLKREKSARIIQKTAQKTGSTILSPACLEMFEPSKTFFMFLFVIPVNQKCQRCTIAIEKQKSASIIQKPAQKNRQHDSFACLFGDVWAVKDVFHVSVCDASESECQRCTTPIKMRKSASIIQKTA